MRFYHHMCISICSPLHVKLLVSLWILRLLCKQIHNVLTQSYHCTSLLPQGDNYLFVGEGYEYGLQMMMWETQKLCITDPPTHIIHGQLCYTCNTHVAHLLVYTPCTWHDITLNQMTYEYWNGKLLTIYYAFEFISNIFIYGWLWLLIISKSVWFYLCLTDWKSLLNSVTSNIWNFKYFYYWKYHHIVVY